MMSITKILRKTLTINMNILTKRLKKNNNNIIYCEIKPKLLLIPGTILLTSSAYNIAYFISPSPIKHASMYYRTNLLSYLITLKKNIKENNILTKIYDPKSILKHIDFYINSVNDSTEYVIGINELGFQITPIEEFLKDRDVIFLLYYNKGKGVEKKLMNDFAKYMCNFIGSTYSFKRYKNTKYCFEAIYHSIRENDEQFNPQEVSIFSENHYNSIFLTRSGYFDCVYKYKFGFSTINIKNYKH